MTEGRQRLQRYSMAHDVYFSPSFKSTVQKRRTMTSVPLEGSQIIDEKEVDQGLSDQDNDKSVSSSASDSSNECPFGTDICVKLTAAFAKATGIDREFAVQLLKDHGWNVDKALKATYEAKEHAQSILHSK